MKLFQTRSNRRRRKSRSGATTVEMAICLPVLFIFLFGAYELGRANMLLHATESAAYEGARVGILPGATVDKVEEACLEILASVGIDDADVTVTPRVIQQDTPRVIVQIDVL